MGRRREGTIGGTGAQRRGDWSADGVSCETKWERGTIGEPTIAFIESRWAESGRETPGRRWRWDINGGIDFEAEKKREGCRGGVNLMGEMKGMTWHFGSASTRHERAVDGDDWRRGTNRSDGPN
jgi:hypothetical protein